MVFLDDCSTRQVTLSVKYRLILILALLAFLINGCKENRTEHGNEEELVKTDVSLELRLLSDINLDGPRSIMSRVIEQYPDLSIISRLASYDEMLEILSREPIPDLIYIAEEEASEEVLDKLKELADRGIVTIIPANTAPGGLYFNQDLFDKFGVPYPKDGLSWDELAPMIRKLTRQEGGIQYYGFAANIRYLTQSNPWSLPLIDRDLRIAVFNNEIWKNWFVQMNTTFNAADKVLSANELERSMNLFVKDKTLAMWAGNDILHSLVTSTEGLNWDVVSLPYVPEIPFTAERAAIRQNIPFWVVSDAGEHSAEAYLLLSNFLSQYPPRTDRQVFLGELANKLKGKNFSSIFRNNMKSFTLNPRDSDDSVELFAREELYKKLLQVISNQLDVNTALREAEEMTNLQIRAADRR